MDEKPNEIMDRIESQRNRLGQNIEELERRVKENVDLRAQFERHPMMAVGLAFGGGLLLSSMMGGESRSRRSSKYEDDWSSSSQSYDRDTEYDRSSSSFTPTSRYASSSYSGPGSSYSGSSYPGSSSGAANYYGSESGRGFYSGKQSYSRPRSQTMNALSGWLQNSKIAEQKNEALRTVDQMGAAFLAMAADKLKDLLDNALPGFKDHFQQNQQGQHGQPMRGQHGEQGQQARQQNQQSGNWSTEPAQQGSYTNQGAQPHNWPSGRTGSEQSGWSSGSPQGQENRSARTPTEPTGSVQADASGSSYRKP